MLADAGGSYEEPFGDGLRGGAHFPGRLARQPRPRRLSRDGMSPVAKTFVVARNPDPDSTLPYLGLSYGSCCEPPTGGVR